MSRKRCCCGGSTNGGYPCQPCPSGEGHEWLLDIDVVGTIGDSAGDGVVNNPDILQPCLTGGCGRKIYSRRAAGNTDFMDPGCFDLVCDSIIDEAAPTNPGFHRIRWSFCSTVLPSENPGNPSLPDILNDQSGAVFIEFVLPNVGWDFGTCTYGGGGGNDCCTVIKVYFTYNDTFPFVRINSDADGCYSVTEHVTTSQTWTCYYVRRVLPGQYFAQGQYYLLRCEYPAPASTTGPTSTSGRCSLSSGVICSSQHFVSISPPTTWKPPATISVVRLS